MVQPALDLRRQPWRYPGPSVRAPGLLADGRYVRCDHSRIRAILDESGHTPLEHRTPVVAVGSNACAAVMSHKLAGHDGPIVFLVDVVAGVAVGHSAHRSRAHRSRAHRSRRLPVAGSMRPGFIPAAPYADAGARDAFVITMLDDEQLAVIDATEPNYFRDRVSGARLGPVWLYRSRWGVLAPPGAKPVPLTPQPVLERFLTGHRLGIGPPVAGAFADVAGLREAGWARADGLDRRASRPGGEMGSAGD
ncbi:hypothetical protein GCM10027169_30640 [Gordonia jinhuaensis]|uniref:Uncharacterized protein n=1 Tax=Gordonia jinhuaensis TaxID=1517702 RepID=A0A916WWH7_9ACTN|nr:hypothetical protein [Gordonia jinhuaensis]GGB35318.1 hypothetical protein GCM10011489_24190 [Gordonia jinhuaensis]